jgi:hypothetical protein
MFVSVELCDTPMNSPLCTTLIWFIYRDARGERCTRSPEVARQLARFNQRNSKIVLIVYRKRYTRRPITLGPKPWYLHLALRAILSAGNPAKYQVYLTAVTVLPRDNPRRQQVKSILFCTEHPIKTTHFIYTLSCSLPSTLQESALHGQRSGQSSPHDICR